MKHVVFLILAGVLVVPGYFAWHPVIVALGAGEARQGEIVSCDARKFASAGGARRSRTRANGGWRYAPIALSEDGSRATGLYFTERAWCEKLIGHRVTLYTSPANPEQGRIGGWLHFWLWPSAWGVACLFFGFVMLSRPGLALGVFFGFAGLSVALALKEFSGASAGGEKSSPTTRSVLALSQCAMRAMATEGVQDKAALKRLACGEMGITDISELENFTGLQILLLPGNQIEDISPLRALPGLKRVNLSFNRSLVSLDGLEGAKGLEILQLRESGLSDFSALSQLTSLREVDFYNARLTDISPLEGHEKLEKITLSKNPLADISPLAGKPRLREITLYSTGVTDISPLFGSGPFDLFGVSRDARIPCNQITLIRKTIAPSGKAFLPDGCE